MTSDRPLPDSWARQVERLLLGAGRRYLPVPESLGDQPVAVEASLSATFGRLSGRLRADLRWSVDPAEIRIVRVGRFNTANDRARVVSMPTKAGASRSWLEQRVRPFSIAYFPAVPLLLVIVTAVQRDLPMAMFWSLFWLSSRTLIEGARRADSRLLQRLLHEAAQRADTTST